jgi:hypothetical protein
LNHGDLNHGDIIANMAIKHGNRLNRSSLDDVSST